MPTTQANFNKIAAKRAGLRYVSNKMPGYYRRRKGKNFVYLDAEENVIKNEEILTRIKKLVIPPAWENVWICPYENGHLQVIGYDVKGRKQYKYHADWSTSRNLNKFSKMREFADALPKIRKHVDATLQKSGFGKEKVVAAVVGLLDKAFLRIGNDEYTKTNKSYGLTTLRDRHVEIDGSEIKFSFIGKKGVEQNVAIEDKRLAKIVKKCRDIPGFELFQYYNESGKKDRIESGDVNEWLQEVTGKEFTAKDFRTWAGTIHAFKALRELEIPATEKDAKKSVVEVIKSVAHKLGNTVAVCRKYYVHPEIISMFNSGKLHSFLESCENTRGRKNFTVEECMLVKFLHEVD